MDRDIEQFFKTEKHSFNDGDEFLARLNGRLTYYHHYESLARQLEAERRRGRYLALGFIGVSLLAIVLVLALLKLPLVLTMAETLSALTGVDNLGMLLLLCAAIGLTFSLTGYIFVKLRCS